MKRMPKYEYIPEIRISPSEYCRRENMENDSHSECAMSEAATDCEALEASYSKRPKAVQGKNEDRDEDVILTDVDASSDDERETVVRYPIDCINSILDLGMSCEEISNSQGPNKRQKSITCSLERSKPRSLNADKFDEEGGTDVEGVFMSEDEDAYVIDSGDEVQDFEPTAYVSIADKVVTGTIASPRVTPEPFVGRKKRSSNLIASIPISSVLTDTEMLISDTESNAVRSRKMTKAKPFKTIFDGFASDTDDSDSSTGHNSKTNYKPHRKMNSSRSFDSIKNSSSPKNSMLAPLRKEDGAITDTENIYLDDAVTKVANKRFETRPTVIRMNKPVQSTENTSAIRYRHNAVKSKSQASQASIQSFKKCNEKTQKQAAAYHGLKVPLRDDTGNATDVETFGSDSDDQTVVIKPVDYLPNPKRELIIDNESHKGKMAIILPITGSKKCKSLRVDDLDCGYSDVEDLPGFEADEYFRYPTPELPRTEHSTVRNKEAVIDPAKLAVELATREPLTDTEELDLCQKPISGNRLKVKLNQQTKYKDINECHTDIEDLDGSDTENRAFVYGKGSDDIEQVELTDMGELSSDDSDDDGVYRFTAVTPDLDMNNTYTNARESMSPFSFDVRRKLNEAIPKIRTISPSPIQRNTSSEDFLTSQEESGGNWASDDGHIEAHSSQIHIKNTRKFKIDEAEKLHIKGFVNYPDPTTDVEELTILEALEELRKKKRKLQLSKELSEGAANKLCYRGPKGPSCKPNTKIYKSSYRHDKPRGADKSKEAVDTSWISQHESGFGEMRLCAREGLRSPYDNINSVYYKEMADESVYPPQLGYAEFESHDVLGSTSSLAQEHGTDTFSELLFSSSNSESEGPDENFPISKEDETYEILYDMSSHINKVPKIFAKRTEAVRAATRPDSPQDLESRLKYYHNLCNRSLSPEVHGVSPAERAELKDLEESISQMLIDIRREERIFYSDNFDGATNTVKRRPKPKNDRKALNHDEKYKKMNEDGETALKEIESHISKLLQDVEKEEREVMGSLRRDFKNSSEKLEGSAPSPWDMINATTTNEDNADVSYVRFRESSCTPSPVESSSTSEDEYDVVPRVELNIGSRLGRSTIDISVKNSPAPRRKTTRMNASKKSLNRSLPSLKSSSLSLVWKGYNSSESVLERPTLWQSSSVEYISPPQRIEPGSGYCIWSYPSEDEYGQDQVTKDVKKIQTQDKKSKDPQDQKSKDKGKRDVKKEPAKKNEKPTLLRKDSSNRVSPDKTPEPSKKVSPDKKPEPSKKVSPDKTPEPSKKVSPDKKPEPSKKASPDKKPEQSKKTSPDKIPEPSKTLSPDKKPEPSKKVSLDMKPEQSKKVSPDKIPEPSKKVSPDKKPEPSKKVSPDKTPEPSKKVSLDMKPEPSKKVSPDKTPEPSIKVSPDKKPEPSKKVSPDKTPEPSKKISPDGKQEPPKKVSPDKKPDPSKKVSPDKTPESAKKVSSHKTPEPSKKVTSDKTPESAKKVSPIKTDEKVLERRDSKNTPSPEKRLSADEEKVTIAKVSSKTQKSLEIKDGIEVDGSKKISTKDTKKELMKSGATVKDNVKPKEGLTKVEEKITKEDPEPPKGTGSEKKATILGKTIETIKKPFQDKGSAKEEKAKGKGKGKSKQKSIDSVKMPSLEIDEPIQERSSAVEDEIKSGNQSGSAKEITAIQGPVVGKTLEEQEKSINDSLHGNTTMDSVEGNDEGIPKGPKCDGKGKELSESQKGNSFGEGGSKEKETLVDPTSLRIDKTFGREKRDKSEEKGEDEKGQGKPLSVERVSVVEPLIEKTIQDITVISGGSVTKDEVKKDDTGSPKSDKNKARGKDKGKNKPGTAKVPSLEESDKPHKSDTNVVGKAVELIKKPFQSQAKQSDDPKAAQKPGKGKKQKSIEQPISLTIDKDDATVLTTVLPGTVQTEKNVETAPVKDNKGRGKGKGKQKSIESIKTPSIDIDTAVQNEPNLEAKMKEQKQDLKNSETNEKGGEKKSKSKSIESSSTPSLENEEDGLQQGSTPEPTLIDKTLETIKRPFQSKKDDKPASKHEEETEGKKEKKKSKQKSAESVPQPSRGEPKEGTIRTTETVRLIKELSDDRSGQVIEERAIDLVTKPFSDKPPLLKSTSPSEESTRTATLIKELSQDKSGQDIETKAIELVSKPLEQKDITLTKEISPKTSSHTMKEALVRQPLQPELEIQKPLIDTSVESVELTREPLEQMNVGVLPKGKTIATTVIKVTKNLSHDGADVSEKQLDLVSKPFEVFVGTHKEGITEPLIDYLPREESEFKTGKSPTELKSQPFYDILGSTPHSIPSKYGTAESTVLIDELRDKSGQVIKDKSIDLVTEPLEVTFSKTIGRQEIPISEPLIKELSHEKSGFIIEERPIDLVSQPFQDILQSVQPLSSSKLVRDRRQIEERSAGDVGPSGTGPLIKELYHEKSGFIIEERPIDLVSQPFQDILQSVQPLSSSKLVVDKSQIEERSAGDLGPSGTGPLIKELSHEKSGFIIEERPIDLVSQPFQDILQSVKPLSSSKLALDESQIEERSAGDLGPSGTGPLIKELSHEKSGFIIEERPIDLVSQPFQDILQSVKPLSSSKLALDESQIEERSAGGLGPSGTGPLIKELSHEKSGFIIEERPIDLVSQPFQGILETLKSSELRPSSKEGTKSAVILSEKLSHDTSSSEDTKELPPSSEEGSTRAVSLIKELSQDQSGLAIEEGAIDLVAQPILEGIGRKGEGPKMKKKESKSKIGDLKKGDESTPTNDFEHIQKTIDNAKSQFNQFVEIVSDKAGKLSSDKTNEKEPIYETKIMSTVLSKEIQPSNDQEVEIPVEKEEDLLRIQKTIQHGFQNTPSGMIGTVDVKTVKTNVTKPIEQGLENVQIQSEKVGCTIEQNVKKFTESVHRGFQDMPSGISGTIDVSTVTTTITKPIEQGLKNVQIQSEKVKGAIETDVKTVTESVRRGFQDIPSGTCGTIDVSTVTTTITKPIEQVAENVRSQGEKVKDAIEKDVKKFTETVQDGFQGMTSGKIGTVDPQTLTTTTSRPVALEKAETEKVECAIDKDLKTATETVQHGFQNILTGRIGTIDLKTAVPTFTNPFEQEAEDVVGPINKNVKKVSETVSKSVDGGVTIIEKTIETHVKSAKDAPATLVEKTIVTVQEDLPNLHDSFQTIGKIADKGTDHNLPSQPRATINVTTITATGTEPYDQLPENIFGHTQYVAGVPLEEKINEGDKSPIGGKTTTVESQADSMIEAPATFIQKAGATVKGTLDDGIVGLGKIGRETMETFGKSKSSTKSKKKDEAQAVHISGKEGFPPEFRAQSVKIATFETVETISPPGTGKDETTTILTETATGSSNDEIGRIIKEMESQLLSTKFGLDDSTINDVSEVEIEDYTRQSRTMPTTPLPARKMFGDTEAISDSEGDLKPYVTTPTLSRRVIGVGGSQRLTQDERPVVRVITEYVGDLSESEPEEDTYTVLEPEVRERRKFKIRFSPDLYGSEDREDAEEVLEEDVETEYPSTEALERSDSMKSEKNIKRIERKFERMTSHTKEADPIMSEETDGEFQRMVSQLSLEEMDQALHQWDAGGLTPSEIDSRDLTLSSDDTTSPLQQGLTDLFRPKLSSILPTSIYVEKTGTEVGGSGLTESSKMKLSLVKDSVPKIFRSIETDGQVKEGSHTLEPGETGETPPTPSPRTPLKPTDSQDIPQDQTQILDTDDDESKNYATRKIFWEQMSTGSVETSPPVIQEVTPPVPKPRIRSSISQSIDLPDVKKAVSHSEASTTQEVSEIGEFDKVLHGVTTTASVARESTSERGISLDADTNSEMEFMKTHDIEELSYDNDAFDDDMPKDIPIPAPKQRKGIYERSVSLPGDTTIDISNNVRSKKRIFEAQIKKEMVVEQLMSQMEEEGSPEHKAFAMTTEPTDQEAMLDRQIHSEIVSHELEEQIESNLLENKALVQNKAETDIQKEHKQKTTIEVSPVKTEDDASESDKTNDTSSELPSIYETKISSTVAEVLHYKNDAISKPSDSMEVHVDKSELEDTEKVKEIEEELRVIDEKYESHQLIGSDQTKVSSITSSQGESEDTFSESDVTPEDARFKEQLDIQVWGPSDRDVKLTIDKLDDQKKTRSVHTPEEHIPDTVWEVPVQESTEPLEVETVGQLPTADVSWQASESEARQISEIFTGEIESEVINRETMVSDPLGTEKDGSKIKTPEQIPSTKKSDNMLKLIRTDTTTSSMEITDEDLRSSGMTDNSPLESQAGIGPHFQGDVFGEDSGDDVDAQELDRDTIGKDVVEKTLAEVKQSLEAVKEELIEEKKKKRDSITKESPSEFEFKSLVLEKTFSESIQEHHQEEATIESKSSIKTSDGSFSSRSEKSEVSQVEESYSSFEQTSLYESQSKTTVEKSTSESTAKVVEPINTTYSEISEKKEITFEEHKTSSVESSTLLTTSTDHDTEREKIVEPKEIKTPGSTTGSEVSIKSANSQDTVIEKERMEKRDSTVLSGEVGRTEKVIVTDDLKDESISQNVDLVCDPPAESEERKSPLDDVFSNSSSSDYKGGSNDASTLDKPNIIIRKHKKSTLGTKDPKSDGELYSSSGSHYESFEQTSESIKSPGSRPLSSDVEGLVAATAGMTTGSSEYESAVSHEISGQSTTITSRDYQTAVSSLSSRDSMKSLDSESSGNLASIEVSSEASETLVPSAMELEKDNEEPAMKHHKISSFTIDNQVKMQSFSESIEQSVSFDISGEDISEDDYENQVQPDQDQAIRMKRSHEMTFQPEPRPILLEGELSQGQEEKLASSLDDMSSLVSTATDTGANRTVIELSKTESERMDGSATSEQLSLTVSGTSDLMSLSESRELDETTVLSRTETIATQSPPFQQSAGGVESVTITTSSIMEQGIQSVCTQVTSKVEMREVSHSNGPTQVEYNAEYDEGDHEVKKRGHRRNGSTSFRPSMIPVFQSRETKKKSEDIIEDSAESDKYTQPLTVKEGTQEEKKDVDETEKPEEEFYKTEADQAMNRDLREGRISIGDASYGEGAKSFDSSLGSKSRLHSAAFSDDHPDSEIAELLKQCSSDIPSEDPIERPKTPEPVEECELKDDTPEFSSEAQASVTELEMEYSGAFSRSAEYAAHVSPIREKGLPSHESWEHLSDGEQTMDDSMLHSRDPLHLGFEDSASEKHELETHESTSKEKTSDRSKFVSSPVPDITVTQHMHPTPQDSFEKIEIDSADPSITSKSVDGTVSPENSGPSKEMSKGFEDKKDDDSDSPTSDSFELLEKPDIADEFVIIEEVGREASEHDTEGKSVTIDMKRVTSRVGSSSAPIVVSPPTTVTKMTQVKYFSSGATEEEIPFNFDSGSPAKSAKSEKESSQEGSPPSAEEPDFKPDLEESKKWMEMQFQGAEPIAQVYGYDVEYDRGPLEDIKEEDINDLEGSSRIGSMGSQVSQSIGSFGSVKESLSSTPDYDVLAGRKFFARSGEHDDVSMSSLQEFERLEHLIAMESSKHKSLGSQDSLTSSSNNSRKQGSRSGGDDISLASLKEFEGLESACIAAERIETKAKADEESLLSEIEEGHESQASESESCATISVGGMQRGESDEDDYERRMFEIDEIIRQAQTNVEQFMDSKNRETVEGGLKTETLGRADSLEEISKVPELDLDQPLYSVSYSSGKSYIQQWEDLGDDLITSTDSLELKTQKSKTSAIDPFTTSTDSLDVKISQDVMSVSTDSIEASRKVQKKDIMTDSIEVGEKTSMLTSVDSLEGKVTQANSIDEDEHHAMGTYDQSSSSGKEGDLSSSGKDDSAEGAVGMNRMPPPRAEYLLGSTDSLEPTSSTATHATYQYETDSVMSSSFTSGDSATMVDDNDEEGAARASMWFDEGKPYVTEVIEPIIGDEEFSHVIHRKVEMPPEIHKVSFKGMEAEHALREYIEKFDPGEDCTETREVDEHGNVHVKRVIQKRVIVRPEELGGDTTDLSGHDLEKYLQSLTQSQVETDPLIDTIHSSFESHSPLTTTRTTTTLSQGDSIKTEQEQKQTVETHRRGSRPPLKYDISVDEEPEFDPREHDWRFNLHTHIERDEETQEGAYGFSENKTKGTKK